jgi:hypothetical protein
MSIDTRTSHLVKKTGVEKSRWTVPLREGRANLACNIIDLGGDLLLALWPDVLAYF